MIVPTYWAEARAQQARSRGQRAITVRRLGWSDVSQAEAERHAAERAQAALVQIAAGEEAPRREARTAYNGASGVPIREEVLARQGDVVVTRNGYGAHCLNTPDVLFADIDFPAPERARWGCAIAAALLVAWIAAAFLLFDRRVALGLAITGLILAPFAGIKLFALERKMRARRQPDPEPAARAQVETFLRTHRDWGLRLYRTPRGLRLLATHAVFDPTDPQVTAWFDALGVDPIYAEMCKRQACFRARVSPKPWRIGLRTRLKPYLWPIDSAKRSARAAWVREYEAKSAGFAACRFVAALGNRTVHPRAEAVRALHDQMAGATSGRPLA